MQTTVRPDVRRDDNMKIMQSHGKLKTKIRFIKVEDVMKWD